MVQRGGLTITKLLRLTTRRTQSKLFDYIVVSFSSTLQFARLLRSQNVSRVIVLVLAIDEDHSAFATNLTILK